MMESDNQEELWGNPINDINRHLRYHDICSDSAIVRMFDANGGKIVFELGGLSTDKNLDRPLWIWTASCENENGVKLTSEQEVIILQQLAKRHKYIVTKDYE